MNEKDKVWAESVPYWKTGKSDPDTWMMRTKRELFSVGGKIEAEAFGSDSAGRSAYMLAFRIGGDTFKVIWPVLPSKGGDTKAARIQAVTALYHDVKARVVAAKFLGNRSAFFNYLLLPNGQTTSEASNETFLDLVPKLAMLGGAR